MTPSTPAVAAAILALAGCGAGAASDDGGPPVAADGRVACDRKDTACPADKPYADAPCEGALACNYPSGTELWTFECTDGRWQGTCVAGAPGACAPILAEHCEGPFTGTVTGAVVELGPAAAGEAFRPFTAGEAVPVVWGGQGLPMLAFSVRVIAGGSPECVTMEITVRKPGEVGNTELRDIALRCGESLTVYAIVPFDVCEPVLIDTELVIDVGGVGDVTAPVKVQGGSCTG